MFIVYVGPHDQLEVAPNGHPGEAFTADRLVPVDVPDALAALLLEQADWSEVHGAGDLAALTATATATAEQATAPGIDPVTPVEV